MSIVNEAKITVPLLTTPMVADPLVPTALESLQLMNFKGKVDAFIKRHEILDDMCRRPTVSYWASALISYSQN